MDRILNKIIEKIEDGKPLFTQSGIEPPAVIDFYAGQPEQPDRFEFITPAVFMDYSVDYNNEIVYIYLHALYDFTPDTENITPGRSDNFTHLAYYGLLKRILRGVRCKPVFGVLKLYQDDPVTSDYAHYHRLTFACRLFDDLDDKYNKYVDVDPVTATVEKGKIKPMLP